MAKRRSGKPAPTRPSPPPVSPFARVYWLLPLALAGIQLWVTRAGLHQIRYEELAEAIRSVWWLDQRVVYDGVYTNVGWYGTLLVVYKLFGFSIFTAKYVRLALHLAGLYAIAGVLRRAMSPGAAVVPLVVVGLSPTLLYFDSVQTSYAMDLSYAAICLLLVVSIDFGSPTARDYGKAFAGGVVAMVAAMSYPAFAFYVPSLALVAIWLMKRAGAPIVSPSTARLFGAELLGLALPLAAVFLFVRNSRLLVFDPDTQAGLFRAGGHLGFDAAIFQRSLSTVLHDLFVQGHSYYYEVTRPDFSGGLALAGLAVVISTIAYLVASKKTDVTLVVATLMLLATSLVVPNLSIEGEPGLRRCTGALAAYFVLFAIAWRFYAAAPRRTAWLNVGMVLCLLLPLDSALKLPSLVDDEGSKSVFRNVDWFVAPGGPPDALAYFVELVNHEPLSCPIDAEGRLTLCRYQEIYPAIAGYRKWNGLTTADIHARDWKTGRDIVLTPYLWLDHYYPTCTRLANCR
jgi:hypothetical protein